MQESRKTYRVESITDYLKCIKEISCNDPKGHKDIHRCFRGQASANWEITPSLFRYGVAKEYELLTEADILLGKELLGYNALGKLSFLQHYGLPTRLLDVTLNPLVALFFACQIEKDHDMEVDGVVYVDSVIESSHNDLNKISEILFSDNDIPNFLRIELEKGRSNDQEYKYWKSLLTTSHFVMSPLSNDRIERQSGAFIMTPVLSMQIIPVWGNYVINDSQITDMLKNRNIIPASSKLEILKELRECGIHEGFLFPDVEHKIKYITQTMKLLKKP